MSPSDPSLFGGIISALSAGLPHLLLQFAVAVALLAAGIGIYMTATPFRERAMIEEGVTAAGVVLAGKYGAAVLTITVPRDPSASNESDLQNLWTIAEASAMTPRVCGVQRRMGYWPARRSSA